MSSKLVRPPRRILLLMPRRLLRGLVPLLTVGAIAFAHAPPAAAHAKLLRTEPAQGTVTATSPDQVSLTFDEPVETSLGSLRVYDGDGDRVDHGAVTRPGPQQVAVGSTGSFPAGRTPSRGASSRPTRIRSAARSCSTCGGRGHHPGGIARGAGGARRRRSLSPTTSRVSSSTPSCCSARRGPVAVVRARCGRAVAVRRRLYLAIALLALGLLVVSLLELPLQGPRPQPSTSAADSART